MRSHSIASDPIFRQLAKPFPLTASQRVARMQAGDRLRETMPPSPVIANAAKQSIPTKTKCGLLRCVCNDDIQRERAAFQTHLGIPAARRARVMHEIFARRERAWGMPGAHRTRSLACKIEKHTS